MFVDKEMEPEAKAEETGKKQDIRQTQYKAAV